MLALWFAAGALAQTPTPTPNPAPSAKTPLRLDLATRRIAGVDPGSISLGDPAFRGMPTQLFLAANHREGNLQQPCMQLSWDGVTYYDLFPRANYQVLGSNRFASPGGADPSLAFWDHKLWTAVTDQVDGTRFGPSDYSPNFSVLSSSDGQTWSLASVVAVESAPSNRFVWAPNFVRTPEGRMYVDGAGFAYLVVNNGVGGASGSVAKLYRASTADGTLSSWSYVSTIQTDCNDAAGVCVNGVFYLIYRYNGAGASSSNYLWLSKSATISGNYTPIRGMTANWLAMDPARSMESPTILRLKDGRWMITATELAFSGPPTDGYVVTSDAGNLETATFAGLKTIQAGSEIAQHGFRGEPLLVSDPELVNWLQRALDRTGGAPIPPGPANVTSLAVTGPNATAAKVDTIPTAAWNMNSTLVIDSFRGGTNFAGWYLLTWTNLSGYGGSAMYMVAAEGSNGSAVRVGATDMFSLAAPTMSLSVTADGASTTTVSITNNTAVPCTMHGLKCLVSR